MASASRPRSLTADEYLAMERAADSRSEFYDGRMVPIGEPALGMAGARFRHGQIVTNVLAELHARLKGGPCQAQANDLRVALGDDAFAYPDIVVVCGEPQFRDGEFDTLLNPHAIVEVLSPSTEAWDRGGKFAHYRRLPSLRHYVLIAQESPAVERFDRQPDATWRLADIAPPDGTLDLDTLGVAIPLRDVYLKVFPLD